MDAVAEVKAAGMVEAAVGATGARRTACQNAQLIPRLGNYLMSFDNKIVSLTG